MPHIIFNGQKTYENAVLVLRRHWIVLLGIILVFLFLASLPFILLAVIKNLLSNSTGLITLFSFLTVIYFLFWWYGLFYQLTDFILDLWVVTDHRVVDIEQIGLFRRNIAEAALPNIEDVTVKIDGVIPTFFNYGYVHIQTAGATSEIIFKQIHDPNKVKNVILDLYYAYKREHVDGIEVHEEYNGPEQ